jgi:bifunctional UDP-N-acetylglucosamine pyrophosphorylase / glucosamine-1-phosphate N-acetyltransferase
LEQNSKTASLILAAGRGSRMKGFEGSKTLLPLVPGQTPFEGENPILLEILKNLPPGPKAVVVNHRKEEIIEATKGFDLTYCEQPELNGTGGALLAARKFLEDHDCDHLIITMGDVPLVRPATYSHLVQNLKNNRLTVLGFMPEDKKQYGVLETTDGRVQRIIEWKYWKSYPLERQDSLGICNSGIYAGRNHSILHYLPVLESRPHIVHKEINGSPREVKEFFVTDLVEYLCNDGLPVGYVVGNETEVMGVDDLSALRTAQEIFVKRGRA